MKRKHGSRNGYGKLLDSWVPPDDAGDPLGCVATSYTFTAAFFEEECLGRFLGLQTDAREDGAAYLIEREEKLAQLICAAALVDQHHAKGVRSLRWDLLSARPPRGSILHAKVSLLFWTRCARLIIGSANLTEDGYRRNHEVFATLDFHDGSESPLPVLDEAVQFLRDVVRLAPTSDGQSSRPATRWNSFLDRVTAASRPWGARLPQRGSEQPRIFPVFTGPDRPSVLQTLSERRTADGPIDLACVVSPFFDPPGPVNKPAEELWKLVRQKGPTVVEYHLTSERVLDHVGECILVHGPESLLTAQPGHRSNVESRVKRLTLEETRPLHAKSLWLQSSDQTLLMIGSSNFTSRGLGIGAFRNFEANLCFEASRSRQPATVRAMEYAWLSAEPVDTEEIRFLPLDSEDDASTESEALLPAGFVQAIYDRDDSLQGWLQFEFGETLPPEWSLRAESETDVFVNQNSWTAEGSPAQWRVLWKRDRPPSGFHVE